MNKACKVATILVLAVVFSFSVVSVAQAQAWLKTPTWRITKDGTGRWVAWKNHAPNPRFRVYDAGTPLDETDDVVVDIETTLMWEREPSVTAASWSEACSYCWQKQLANRNGWRLPTIEELASLADADNTGPALPTGSPFNVPEVVVQSPYYWSSTSDTSMQNYAWFVDFETGDVAASDEFGGQLGRKQSPALVWCVRGGQGHDGVYWMVW